MVTRRDFLKTMSMRHRRPHAHRADAPRLRRDHGDGGEQGGLARPRQAARDLRHARPAHAFSRGPRVHGARGARALRRAARSPRRNGQYRPRGRTRQPRHDARRHRSPRRRSCARHAPPEGLRRLRCARGCQRADARRPRHNGIGGRRARARRGGDRAPRPCRCR